MILLQFLDELFDLVVQFLLVLFAGHLDVIMVYFMLVEENGREVSSTLYKLPS